MGSNDWFRMNSPKTKHTEPPMEKDPNYSSSLLNKSKEAYFDKIFANYQKTIDSIEKKFGRRSGQNCT